IMPLSFHLGYHSIPIPGVMPGFGHVGLGGCTGWAIPDLGLSIGLVHNRLLTPFVASDQTGFVAIAALIRRGAALARSRGYAPVAEFGAPFYEEASAAGCTGPALRGNGAPAATRYGDRVTGPILYIFPHAGGS